MRQWHLVAVLLCASVALGLKDAQCDIANSLERFDCSPEDASSPDKCLSKGCCWKPVTSEPGFPPLNIPFCYYPSDYNGYRVLNQTAHSNGKTAFLQRGTPSIIDKDIQLLRVDIIYQSNEIARIKIVDPAAARWEPPLPKIPAPTSALSTRYTVDITSDNFLLVSRFEKDSKTTLLNLNLNTLIYTDRFIQISSKLPSDVLYGLGEHKGSLRRSVNFTRLTFYNQDRPPVVNSRLYGMHPFYINVESDGKANGVWIFTSNAMDIILQPTPAITYRPVGGILDFFVFVGSTPAEVVQQYQQLVGNPKMVPYWSLGFHLCRFGYKSTENTREIHQRNLAAGVRIEVQWNDIDYMDQRNDFTLDPVNYKDLNQFVDEIHKSGRHYVMIVDPAVSGGEKAGEYPPYDRGVDYNVFVKDINGEIVRAKVWNRQSSVFPDFTHPNATAYWTEMFSKFHNELDFDGAWIDMNEPSNSITGHINAGCPADNAIVYTPGDEALESRTLCNTDQHAWSSHYNVHNMYGFTEAIATYNALSTVRPNKRPFIISRSSFSGHGAYAGHWTGDVFSRWVDLKDSIPGFLEFALYGVPMVGVDICGFNENTTPELCARWQALGAFYPFARNHNGDTSIDQDPAVFGDQVVIPTRNAFYWRYKLLPHLYTLFYKAHVNGETVTRPLFFEYPEDSHTYDIDEQFFWGNSLMVVPALYQSQTQISAYFPKGVWYDVQNRTSTISAPSAGVNVNITAFNDTISFFMKGGNVVFFQEPEDTTVESRKNPYGVYVFLDDDLPISQGQLFLDDGESIDSIESNNFSLIDAVATKDTIMIGNEKKDASAAPLDTIHVYGIKSAPSRISVQMEDFTAFVYDEQTQLLTLYHINQPMTFIVVTIYY